MYLLCCQIL
uniref:Uncharacterized protein n=1 Tax=Arundo donax TaxID=35708 RepID=A0A0A9BGV7_ARUDO